MTKRRKPTEHNKHSYKSLSDGDLRHINGSKIAHFNRLNKKKKITFSSRDSYDGTLHEVRLCLNTFLTLREIGSLKSVIFRREISGDGSDELTVKDIERYFVNLYRWIVSAIQDNGEVTLEYV